MFLTSLCRDAKKIRGKTWDNHNYREATILGLTQGLCRNGGILQHATSTYKGRARDVD